MPSADQIEALCPNDVIDIPYMEDEEYEGNKQNYEQLRRANSRYMHDLTGMGMEPDIALSMITVYFDGLVAAGVMTKAQLLVVQLGWETHLHQQLRAMHDRATEAVTRAKLTIPGRPQGGLLVPGKG